MLLLEFITLGLAVICAALAVTFYKLCQESVDYAMEDHEIGRWHRYFGWSTFFQGACLAFIICAAIIGLAIIL